MTTAQLFSLSLFILSILLVSFLAQLLSTLLTDDGVEVTRQSLFERFEDTT